MSEIVKLPLWKNCVEHMRSETVSYGKTYTAEYFEEQLRTTRDSMEFGLGISEIRRELEKDGLYLSGRGQKGCQFVILPPSANADVMKSYQRKAIDSLARGVILGTNTRLDTLTESERRKHEGTLERMAIKTALLSRSGAVMKVIREHAPKILSK